MSIRFTVTTYLLHELNNGVFWHIDHALVARLVDVPIGAIQVVHFSLQQ